MRFIDRFIVFIFSLLLIAVAAAGALCGLMPVRFGGYAAYVLELCA